MQRCHHNNYNKISRTHTHIPLLRKVDGKEEPSLKYIVASLDPTRSLTMKQLFVKDEYSSRTIKFRHLISSKGVMCCLIPCIYMNQVLLSNLMWIHALRLLKVSRLNGIFKSFESSRTCERMYCFSLFSGSHSATFSFYTLAQKPPSL